MKLILISVFLMFSSFFVFGFTNCYQEWNEEIGEIIDDYQYDIESCESNGYYPDNCRLEAELIFSENVEYAWDDLRDCINPPFSTR